MRRFCLTVILALAILGCRKEETPTSPPPPPPPPPPSLGGHPEITILTAVNQGLDLQLTWKSVEGAYGYRVYCDGNKIWEGRDTTYTILGSSMVCMMVEVSAYAGSDEMKTQIDLTPKSSTITGLVTHDSPTGRSWVKLDLPNGVASLVRQSDVDKYAPNIGWFVFYNNSGTPQFMDASATSIGTAKMEVAFTAFNSSGYLAPGPGNYNVVRSTSSNAYHFFWADNTNIGYGSMDNYDYFGVIKVTSITGSGPYTADLVIYIQSKVPGLRWVKFY